MNKIKSFIKIGYARIKDFLAEDIKAPHWGIVTMVLAIFAGVTLNLAIMAVALFAGYQWGIREAERPVTCEGCGLDLEAESDEMIRTFRS